MLWMYICGCISIVVTNNNEMQINSKYDKAFSVAHLVINYVHNILEDEFGNIFEECLIYWLR